MESLAGTDRGADLAAPATTAARDRSPTLTRTARVSAFIPGPFRPARSQAQLQRFAMRAAAASGRPRILLVCGTDATRQRRVLESVGARVSCIGTTPGIAGGDIVCDPTRLPLPDGLFDGVVVHRALHRCLEPHRVVAELLRVVRKAGLVHVEEPFVQATLEGPADLFRFTHLGLRALFRECEELDSGIVDGPGAAAASAWRQLTWSLPRSGRMGFVFSAAGSLQSFFWKYLDPWLARRPRALDSAASLYFLGAKASQPVSAAELVAGYRGAAARRGVVHAQARPANEVFTEWAADGRDVGMEIGHAAAVQEMLAAALSMPGMADGFTAVDAGCGNGWVVRKLRASPACRTATGVDGSAGMIARARSLDPFGSYQIGDLMTWQPAAPVDLVVSMEVLYYLADPVALLRRIATAWLKPGGYAVIGIDHYQENEPSLGWPEYVGTQMATWPEAQWLAAFTSAGFTHVRHWRAAPGPGWAGTLVMLVRAPLHST
ncbi:MAG: class I SAM-dependent methyltransferase [Proteobacteria bacterium]|nr:class I SAM-dependent methyltransferase [Pseudomonadota bacterium]